MKDFISEHLVAIVFWLAVVVIGVYFFGNDPEFWDGIFQGGR